MDTAELREMSLKELQEEHGRLYKEQCNLRFQRASDQLSQTHEIKKTRRDIARVNTVIREKQDG